MLRAEIIANQSVRENIIDLLEASMDGILYTLIPVVVGKGRNNRKLGNATWPETNFVLISYISENQEELFRAVIERVRLDFPKEGIKLFFVESKN
ncbi:MAG: hypothetical protein PQJ50_00085 [Spirochaetales bacterium]|nr:hypothetical protein [Spirochaetales bacterium]